MTNYITVDGGTTNTRLTLVSDGRCVDTVRYNVGARANADDSTLLKNAVKEGIFALLNRNNLTEKDITRVLASGMITSEFWLCKLDHLIAPAGIKELHDTMHETLFPDISAIPFVFIRGVKLKANRLEAADMMRGEETELFGLYDTLDGVYILPGSHSKIIEVDENGKITGFKTELTGEMIAALSQNTVLKSTVDLSVEKYSEEYLLKGYRYCNEFGINEALFKVRVLGNLMGADKVQTYSFFMGVVLSAEINTVLKTNPKTVTVGGKKQIKEATVTLLKSTTDAEIISVPDSVVNSSAALGAVRIFEF